MPTVPILEPHRGALQRVLGADADGVDALNLHGDYTYLSSGYYASLDAELAGERMLPTPEDALDAYVVPIAADKARRAGIAVPDVTLVTDRFPAPPFVAWPVNPFSVKGELILDDAALGGAQQRRAHPVTARRGRDHQRVQSRRVEAATEQHDGVADDAAAAVQIGELGAPDLNGGARRISRRRPPAQPAGRARSRARRRRHRRRSA
ncbi:MAG: RimK-like ATPgrasp N-terminal domain-containing protein [Trueperaceae bacterium]|nr:RimK-like ATPgrasp N-terminal domain-containing protein [Trueperaceae bacterium]